MTAYPSWTPAPRPGIIPLRPLTFGLILGRSFAALRHNPRVLLGFAMVVQTVAYLVVTLALSAIAVATFTRLDTVPVGTDEWDAVLTGSIALTGLSGLVLGVLAGAVGILVQAVVITDVLHAALAEKMTLRRLWARVRPVAWRLIGYMVLVSLALGVLVAGALGVIVLVAAATPAAAIAIALFAGLAAIPLSLWLSVKLLLVPAAIMVERASIAGAIARSWRLTRTRFWVVLGIVVLVQLVFGLISQVVSVPFSFLAGALSAVIAPTGDPDAVALIGVVLTLGLTQIVTLLIQSVAIIVQSTATGLLYIDCRMRHEGLDLDLLEYVDRRDAGATDLPDPYLQHIGRAAPSRWSEPVAGWAPPGAWPPPAAPATPVSWAPPAGPPVTAETAPPAASSAAPTPAPTPSTPESAPPTSTTWASPR